MEQSILTPTQKFAAAALFSIALHQSQIHQKRPFNHLLPLTEDEPLGEGASIGGCVSVSDRPGLWIHEYSGLLLPVFRFLGLDDQAWHGLKETAGLSTQARHHIRAFLTILSEDKDEASKERESKEQALTKALDATLLSAENSSASSAHVRQSHEQYPNSSTELVSKIAEDAGESIGSDSKKPTEVILSDKSATRTSDQTMEEGTQLSYQRKVTVLYELLSACVADNVEDKLKSSHLGKGYDARHRVALRLLASWLDIEWRKMEAMETMVACSLVDTLKREGEHVDESNISEESSSDRWKRGGIVGAAALTGGAMMAVTGGLAAPAIAHGLTTVAPTLGGLIPAIGASGFTAAATATGSVAGSVAVAGSFGAAGAGLAGSKMAHRTGLIDEFDFKPIGENHNQGRLAVEIMVSGLIFQEEDFIVPWKDYHNNSERYTLWWEPEKLIVLSTAIRDWLATRIALELMREGAMLTVLSAFMTALALPAALVAAADMIDSKWTVAINRSDQAGKLLAEVLLKGLHGSRPVTLVGFSLGARIIFKCLQCLAETKGDNDGIVERVVLLGAPIEIQKENWEDARKMVAGRFVNAYSTDDWTLGVAFRASLLSGGLAGIQPVNVLGIQNVDVTNLIDGHSSYITRTNDILEALDLDNYDAVVHTTISNTQDVKKVVT